MATVTAESPAVDTPDAQTGPMTYEEYLASPEESARYDILDGWKVYRRYGRSEMASPTRRHQRIQSRLNVLFDRFERETQRAQVIPPPCDILIRRLPLRTRQPDMLLISVERLEENGPDDEAGPLDPAPELVVEIVSPSERPGARVAKLADYRSVDVREVWLIFPDERRVEVVQLSVEAIETVGAYEAGQSVASVAFPGLVAPVDELLAQ